MAFNLGAFAGGLVTGGLKTYTTLSEQERAEAAEARDKERFDEEQRQIELRRQAEALQRKAAIPTAADQPGLDLNALVSALPIGGAKTATDEFDPDLTKTTDAYQEKFKEVFGGLTDEQKALVLRQYGDTSTPGGAAFERQQSGAAGTRKGIPAGLNEAVIREDAGGGRSVVTADIDEKKTVARYKAMAMASGNPVAIKAANEAELTMLNRQVAEQSLKVGQQNIDLNVIKLSEAKDAQDFKTRFNTALTTVTKENNDLLLSINKDSVDENVTLESLVKKYGGKIKDATGDNLLVENGVVYTKDAGGTKTVLANSKEQAIDLLKTNAGLYFAKNLSNQLVSNGLFKDADAFNTFYAAERKYVMDAAGLANSRVMAAAAKKKADTDAAEFEAKKEAGTFTAAADASRNASAASLKQSSYYERMAKIAGDKADLDKDGRNALADGLKKFGELTEDDQNGPVGRALLRRTALAVGSKAGDVTAVLNSMINADKAQKPDWTVSSDGSFRSNAEGVMQDFDPKTNSWKTRGMPEISANAAKLGITAAVDNKGNVGFKGKDGYYTTEQEAVRSYDTKDKTKTSDDAAKTAIPPYTPPASSTAAIELEKRKAVAVEKEQANKALRDAATAAATAAISASSQVDARKVQQMDGFSLLPVAVQAQISKIVNKPVSAIPAAKASAPAAPAAPAAAIAATPAQVKAKLEAKIADGDRLSADELKQAKSMGLINEGGASAAPAAKSINAQREDLFAAMDMAEFKLKQDPNNRQRKAAYEAAKEKFEAFKKANKLTD